MSTGVMVQPPETPGPSKRSSGVFRFLKSRNKSGDAVIDLQAAKAQVFVQSAKTNSVDSVDLDDLETSISEGYTPPSEPREWSGRWRLTPTLYTSTGPRHANEDRLICNAALHLDDCHREMESKQISCFAVFDGHGGSRCSQWLADNLEEDLRCADSWRQEGLTLPKRLKGALVQALKRAEYKYLDLAFKESDHSGACVVVGLYCEGHVCVANVGDCLAVLYLPGADSHVDLSVAHRSRQPEEARRIEAAGGLVINNRAFGVLEPSRSIGDLDLKRHCRGAVTADPYIREVVIPPPQQPAEGAAKKKPALQEAPFLLFASDGLWDVVAAPVVVDLTKKSLKVWRKKPAKSNPARQLVRAAIRHGTMDDTTAIVVHFDAW